MKPTAIMMRHTRMKGYLFPVLSLHHATATARMDAVTYIGTVKSCAVELVYPSSLIIEGRNKEIP
jgi:hypothetical protein